MSLQSPSEGGRPARQGDFTARSGGSAIVADPLTAEAITGTVSGPETTGCGR